MKKKPRKRKRKLRVIQPGETRYWCLMDEVDVIAMAYGEVPDRIQQRLRGMLPARALREAPDAAPAVPNRSEHPCLSTRV